MRDAQFSDLVGKVIIGVDQQDDVIKFICSDGTKYQLWHRQDCCESVYVEDVCGDWAEVINAPILNAEEVRYDNCETPEGVPIPEYQSESFTWTFYKIDTQKGGVTIRWCGRSNGYYSESVDFDEVT